MSRTRLRRLLVAAAGALACTWAAWFSARAGLARLFAEYAVGAHRLDAADAAARLSPADAETHYARAAVLRNAGRAAESVAEYERAAALRPRDYALWIELGRAREEAGDAEGALAALGEAVRDAPYYAQPAWQLGNALLRAGRRDEALAELRRASASDPQLYANFVDLAWYATGADARAFAATVSPRTTRERLAVVKLLVARGESGAAMDVLRPASSELGEEDRRALVAELLRASSFAEAFEVWSGGGAGKSAAAGALVDGGFEQPLRFDEPGFGWQIARARAGDSIKFSLDPSDPREGARSLRLDFDGNSPTDAPLVSQLVVAEPGARYRLAFAARTNELVTGGLPFVRVSELRAKGESAALADSQPLPEGAGGGWRAYQIEFTTTANARALSVSLLRHNCTTSPCPAFGQLWLDGFSLQKF